MYLAINVLRYEPFTATSNRDHKFRLEENMNLIAKVSKKKKNLVVKRSNAWIITL